MISVLKDDLLTYRGGTKKLGFVRRSKAIWNENLSQAHQDRIRGQVVAVSLLLQAIQPYAMHFPQCKISQWPLLWVEGIPTLEFRMCFVRAWHLTIFHMILVAEEI